MSNSLLSAMGQDNSDVDDWLIIEKPPTREKFVPKPKSLQDAVDIIRATFPEEEMKIPRPVCLGIDRCQSFQPACDEGARVRPCD